MAVLPNRERFASSGQRTVVKYRLNANQRGLEAPVRTEISGSRPTPRPPHPRMRSYVVGHDDEQLPVSEKVGSVG